MMLPTKNAFAFTAGVVDAIARNFRALTLAFALPALILLVIPLLVVFTPSQGFLRFYTDDIAAFLAQTIVPLIALVSVVRFLVLGEGPPLDPRRFQWRAAALTASIGVPFWLIVRLLSDFGMATQLYYGKISFSELPPDFGQFRAAFMVYSFAIHSFGLAVIYPLLGPIAVSQTLDIRKAWRLFRHSLPAVVLVSALLIAASWTAVAILQTAAGYLFLAMTSAIQGLSFDTNWLSSFLISILFLPINFIFAIVPAVAVAQLTLGVSSNKPTSTSSASRVPR